MPENDFEPRMPEVDLVPDLAGVFAKARRELADRPQRAVAVLTPGRMVMFVPAPHAGSVAPEHVALVKKLLPADGALNITVIAYNRIEALTKDAGRSIPFVAQLLGFAYVGHNVIVFEGHPSALEAGLRESDVLLVDSAMLPFLQSDWAEVAFRVLRTGGRIFVHSRQTRGMLPVLRSANERGWRYGEPDGEASYANCLLTALARGPADAVLLEAGRPAPELAGLASDPAQLAWIAELPFKYATLDVGKVIAALVKVAGPKGILNAQLAGPGGQKQKVVFRLTAGGGGNSLRIEKVREQSN